jgi:hypothetical protein
MSGDAWRKSGLAIGDLHFLCITMVMRTLFQAQRKFEAK